MNPAGRRPRTRARRRRLAALGHRRSPSSRRGDLGRRHRGLARRAPAAIRGWWPRARWGSTITTIIRPGCPAGGLRGSARAGGRGREAGRHPRPRSRRGRRGHAARTIRRSTAILHSFSSGPALLRAGLDLGHYVSFSGMVTFKNWHLDDAIRADPAGPAAGRNRRALSCAGPASRQAQRAGLRPAGRRADRACVLRRSRSEESGRRHDRAQCRYACRSGPPIPNPGSREHDLVSTVPSDIEIAQAAKLRPIQRRGRRDRARAG